MLITKNSMLFLLLIITYITTVYLTFSIESNPDWSSYKKIFDDGAWLKAQNRDPLFLWIIDLFKIIFGPDSYKIYRIAMAFYFSIFIYYITINQHLYVYILKSSYLSIIIIYFILCAILITRFTIQLREGLALTFAAYSLGAILSCSIKKAYIYFIIGALIHSIIMIPLFIYFLTSTYSRIKTLDRARLLIKTSLLISSIVISIYLAFYISNLDAEIVSTSIINDSRFYDRTEFNFKKLFFLFVYGFITLFLYKETKASIAAIEKTYMKEYLLLQSGTVTLFFFLLIATLIINGGSTAILTSIIRILFLLIGLNLLTLIYLKKIKLQYIIVAIAMIADQIRTVVTAVN